MATKKNGDKPAETTAGDPVATAPASAAPLAAPATVATPMAAMKPAGEAPAAAAASAGGGDGGGQGDAGGRSAGSGGSGSTPAGDAPPLCGIPEDLRSRLADAEQLLSYVLLTKPAVEPAAGGAAAVSDATIETIRRFAALVEQAKDGPIPVNRIIGFDRAYRDLASVAAPVTARSLRATRLEDDSGARRSVLRLWLEVPAFTQSLRLWGWTLALSALAIYSNMIFATHEPVIKGNLDPENYLLAFLQNITPFLYGGIGACLYLLRSLHTYISDRSFDELRVPEYNNRILLGVVGGGAIVMLVDQVTTEDGTAIQLSAAALGFLAGYSSDFLFNTVERITAAILPKVGIDSVRRRDAAAAPPAPMGTMTLADLRDWSKELTEKLQSAKTDDEKQTYRALLNAIARRLAG
ncbi:MAG: hypothetical protein GC191_00395 [Azospirillum sp.]|nr:hypothetical protein [Azospirillum sp.]